MAESTHHQDPESSEESTPPVRRARRRAGAPAGAPAPIEQEPQTTATQPRTIVPEQTAVTAPEDTAPAVKRPRRRAGAPAGAPVFSEQPEPLTAQPAVTTVGSAATEAPQDDQPAAAEPAAEPTSAESQVTQEKADDEQPTADRDDATSSVADDLRSLANARGGAAKESREDRAARRERAQLDFASLLFQAPTKEQPRTTVGANDAPVGSADLAFEFGAAPQTQRYDEDDQDDQDDQRAHRADNGDHDVDDSDDSDESSSRGTTRRSRSRRRGRSFDTGEDAEPGQSTSSDDDDGEDSDESGDDESRSTLGGTSRRRRRRGGRGRRGRGRSEDERDSEDRTSAGSRGSEDSEDSEGTDDLARQEDSGNGRSSRSRSPRGTDAAHDDGSVQSEGSAGADGSSDESDDGDQGSSGSSSSRRRRRRRRSGTSNDDVSSPDDPPNTVVKVREARDEVKAVKGSTRLEAKKQRRREGRDAGRRRSVITEAEFLARRESVKRSMIVRERPGRTQIAVLEDNVLVEHYVAQKAQTSMVGNVYLGKVQNVLPSMEAAFVDIGKGRNAVLYAGEVNWDAAGLEGQPRRIELALKSGDPVLVQVTKDPIGHKGARLTSQISLPGRYVVFVPGGSMTGISRKLPENERARLKKLMRQLIPEDAGVIVRTAAEGASEEELTHDVERLRSQWEQIQKAQKSKPAPAALSQEPDIAIKVVRDVFNEDFTALIVEGDKVYQDIHEYVSSVAPDLLERVTKHVGEKDAFAKHRIDEQLLKAMDRKVYLPSGGSLVIDRTEAMTVVDVNTGKFTGSGGSLEETVTKNNLEAAEEIVRQLRLRDIGGIIVIDFIDMVLEANRDLVLRRLVECLGRDRTKHQVAEVTSLGLVQMTRKRVGQGLVDTFSHPCEHCNGRGLIVDIDGHDHGENNGGGNGNGGGSGNDSSRSNKRRGGRRSRSDGQKDAPETTEGQDIHRLEDDVDSRALARATIASIAAASGAHVQPEVTVDGQVVAVDGKQEAAAEQTDQVADADHAARAAGSGGAIPLPTDDTDKSDKQPEEQPDEKSQQAAQGELPDLGQGAGDQA